MISALGDIVFKCSRFSQRYSWYWYNDVWKRHFSQCDYGLSILDAYCLLYNTDRMIGNFLQPCCEASLQWVKESIIIIEWKDRICAANDIFFLFCERRYRTPTCIAKSHQFGWMIMTHSVFENVSLSCSVVLSWQKTRQRHQPCSFFDFYWNSLSKQCHNLTHIQYVHFIAHLMRLNSVQIKLDFSLCDAYRFCSQIHLQSFQVQSEFNRKIARFNSGRTIEKRECESTQNSSLFIHLMWNMS